MAKTHKLSSAWNVTGGVLTLELSAEKDGAFVKKFERKVNLNEVFGNGYGSLNEAGQAALDFGAFTALRNSTGSCDTIDEAEAAIDRRLDAWNDGEWGAEREGSATPFTKNALIAQAVERASKGAQSAEEAAVKLSALAESTCTANNLAAFATLEASERAKIRKAVVESIKESKPAIAAALSAIEAERQAAALKRKQEAAEKAAAAAGDDASGSTL